MAEHSQRDPLQLPPYPFDYVYLTDALKAYRYPRNKIRRLLAQQAIIRLKKGLYIAGQPQNAPIQKKTLANLLYGPSYISLASALSYWGFIPERVEEITSVTTKRNKFFTTPLGAFSYRYLPIHKFNLAAELLIFEQTSFLIATREKAICDTLYFAPSFADEREMVDFLEHDVRMEIESLPALRITILKELRQRFQDNNVSIFVSWYLATRRLRA